MEKNTIKEMLNDSFWIMPATPNFINVGVPYITSKNIKEGKILFDNVKYITQEDYNSIAKNRPIEVNDIVISMIGTLGEAAIVKDEYGKFYGQNVYLLRLDGNKLNHQFFIFFMNSLIAKRHLESNMNQSAQRYLKAEHIESLPIPKMTISEQADAVEILSILSNIISKRKEQLGELDTLIKSRFDEMFGDPSDNQKNWNVKTFDDITTIVTYGLTVRPEFVEEGVDLISAREIRSGIVEYKNSPKISWVDFEKLSDKAKPQKEEILLSKTGSVGHCALITEDREFAVTQNAARIGLRLDIINPLWILYYIKTDYIQKWCNNHAKGNAVKDFQIQDIKRIPVFDCNIELQNQFAEFVKVVDKLKVEVQKSLDESQLLFDSLMQKYFE